jgi:hypothetical protein
MRANWMIPVIVDAMPLVLNGDIRLEFPITVTGEVSRRRLSGRIDGGGHDLNLSTSTAASRCSKRNRPPSLTVNFWRRRSSFAVSEHQSEDRNGADRVWGRS